MKPVQVADHDNLVALAAEFKKQGATIIYRSAIAFTAYKDGKPWKAARIVDDES